MDMYNDATRLIDGNFDGELQFPLASAALPHTAQSFSASVTSFSMHNLPVGVTVLALEALASLQNMHVNHVLQF